jgi:hypothetical protein
MGSRSRKRLIAVVVAALVVVVAGGATAAAVVPVYAISAQRSLGAMLPATTALYVAVDLNPSGATRTDLGRIERAFTSQRGWSKDPIVSQLKRAARKDTFSGGCRRTEHQAAAQLDELGHNTALALTSTAGLNLAHSNGTAPALRAFKRDFVVLAPIHVQRTLFQALTEGSGLLFAHPIRKSVYHGTTIYAERLKGCHRAGYGAAPTIYAADVQNWVILGLAPTALHPIINTVNGKRAALDTVVAYKTLMARLPAHRLASYYLSGKTVRRLGLLNVVRGFRASSMVPASMSSGLNKSSAGALSVNRHGFLFTALELNSAGYTRRAGILASSLPADAEAYLSLQGVKRLIQAETRQLAHSGMPGAGKIKSYTRDITSQMAGEVDVVLFPLSGRVTARSVSRIHLALMWQVKSRTHALRGLAKLARAAHLRGLRTAKAPDGTRYHHVGKYGYAVRHGWAIASPNILRVIDLLSGKSHLSLANRVGYRSAIPLHAVPSSVWYLNLVRVRRSLEAAYLPTVQRSVRRTYRTEYKPLVAPLLTLSGSAGRVGSTAYIRLVLDIGRATRR